MLQHLQAYLALAWAFAQAHPLLALTGAFTVSNAVALRLVATQPPDSRLYHLGKLLLGLVVDVLGIVNAVLGILGKPPVVLGTPPKSTVAAGNGPNSSPTPPGGSRAALFVLAGLAALLAFSPAPARAQAPDPAPAAPRWSYGPAIPMVRGGFGTAQPIALQPGLGGQVAYRFARKWSVDLAALATVVSGPTPQSGPFALLASQVGTLSVAPFLCYGAGGDKKACGGLVGDLLRTTHDGLLQRLRDFGQSIGVITSTNFDLVQLAELFSGS